jgi:DNA invertase Pin-like site-specific DNA recombinase
MAIVAYVRVSSTDQSFERQLNILESSGVKVEKFFKEKISGKDTKRPQLNAMLDYVREGDVVYITEFSRLARSTSDLLSLIRIFEEKKVILKSIKENLDLSTPQGRLMLTMLGAIAEFEREMIRERQQDGIKTAVKTGVTKTGKAFGRPKHELTEERKVIIQKWVDKELNLKEAVDALGVSQRVAYTLKDEYLGKK